MFVIFGEYVCFADADIVYSDELPGHIRAFLLPKLDGGYTIVVNLKLNDEARRKAVEHELKHIFSKDSESSLPVIFLEKSALPHETPSKHKKTPAD
ncbi:MAG: hypothetical protein ACOYI3_06625 [Christensenellales bacterium]